MAADNSAGPKLSSAVTTVKKNDNSLTVPVKVSSSKHKRTASTAQKSKTSTFVSKLWSMINDDANSSYIHWMPDGKSFQVTGREQFEAKILPKYFKHKNFSSFVRQLNMYGWHKVQDISSGTMNNSEEKWQFESPNFIRGREDLLENIQRNKGTKESDDEDDVDLGRVLEELQNIKKNQISLGQDLMRIREDNQLLWSEHLQSQERYKKQAETLDKIVRFLASLYGNQTKLLTDILNPSGSAHQTAISDRNPLLLMPATETVNDSVQSNSSITPIDMTNFYQVPQSSTSDTLSRPGRITVLPSPRLVDVDDDNRENSLIPAINRPGFVTTPASDTTPAATAAANTPGAQSTRSESGSLVPVTPRNLFPELDTLQTDANADNDATSKLLESNNDIVAALSREFDSQDMSIEQVQNWIEQMSPGYNRNLDDYDIPPMTATAGNSPGGLSAISNGLTDPSPGDGAFDVNEFLTDMGPNDSQDVSVPVGKEVSPPAKAVSGDAASEDAEIERKPSKRRRTRA